MSRLILGCDPGVEGSYALVRDDGIGVLCVDDMPIAQRGTTKWIDGNEMLSALQRILDGRECTAVVEHVHAMPKNGSKGAFSQGGTLCSLLAILQIAKLRLEFVPAGHWKKQLGIVYPKDAADSAKKEICRQRARQLFPGALHRLERKGDHNRAEALLLAHWYISRQGVRAPHVAPETTLQAGQGTLL